MPARMCPGCTRWTNCCCWSRRSSRNGIGSHRWPNGSNNGMPAGGCRGAAGFHPDASAWELGRSDVTATRRERLRYALFSTMHRQFFSRKGWLGKAFGWSMTRPIWQAAVAAHALHAVERMVKRPLVGAIPAAAAACRRRFTSVPRPAPRAWRTVPWRHPAQSLRIRRPGVRAQRQIPDRQIGRSIARAGTGADSCIEAADRHRSSWPAWFTQRREETRVRPSACGSPELPP